MLKLINMSGYSGMHRAQVKTLDYLRRHKQGRFSRLADKADMTSDSYKFHLRRLAALGYVSKTEDGIYELTPTGKSYANRLNTETGLAKLDPKASMLLIITAVRDDVVYYLVQRRARQPFYDYYGIASAPVEVGISVVDTATAECKKQTGMQLGFVQKGYLRVIDRDTKGDVLEDKFFALMAAEAPSLLELSSWSGGDSQWCTKSEMLALEPLFASTEITLEMISSGKYYAEYTCVYDENHF